MPRVYIETYGCAFNASDSEAMAGLLADEGFTLLDSEERADVVVLNSCTVKDRTYLDFRKRLGGLKRAGRAVVVAGCVPKANPSEPLLQGVAQIGTNNLGEIGRAVEAAIAARVYRQVDARREERIGLRSIRRNPAIEILPINHGCLSACSFCQTRLARGTLHSFPVRAIVSRARQALAEGVSELWLTSQDTGAYGADIGSSLPRLLEALAGLGGDFRIRLGMSSPQWIRRDQAALLDVFESPRLYQFLHVPAQSGSERIVRLMKRGHAAADFEAVCEAFRDRFPRMAIWTDIIAGFPSETREEFEQSLALIRRTRPATVNRSRFSARPGTAAADLPPLPSAEIMRRSRELNALVEHVSRESLLEWRGWEGPAWASEIKKAGSAVCRNAFYRPIIVPGEHAPGRRMRLRVTGTTTFHLEGEVVEEAGAL